MVLEPRTKDRKRYVGASMVEGGLPLAGLENKSKLKKKTYNKY
jgi:hypothetical protein